MARQRMVTRTVKVTTVKMLCMDTTKEEAVKMDFTVTGTFKDEKAVMKAVKKLNTDSTIIPTRMIEMSVSEKQYGMLETEFVKYANEMTKN